MVVAPSATLDLFFFLQQPFQLRVDLDDLTLLRRRRGLHRRLCGRYHGRGTRFAHLGPPPATAG